MTCQCAEIAEADRPCLDCRANYAESWWWKPPQPEPPPREERVHVARGGKGEVARLRERRTK